MSNSNSREHRGYRRIGICPAVGDITLDPQLFEHFYITSKYRKPQFETMHTEADINAAFHSWSKGVEDAVKKTVAAQHDHDPLHCPQPVLPKKFFGRCAPTKFVTHTFPKTAREDPTHAYNPPVEATTCKARLKTRQVRRIAPLLRQIKLTIDTSNNNNITTRLSKNGVPSVSHKAMVTHGLHGY